MDEHNISNLDIQALVDNELSWEEEKKVRRYLDAHPGSQKHFESLRNQKKLLQEWWRNRKSH